MKKGIILLLGMLIILSSFVSAQERECFQYDATNGTDALLLEEFKDNNYGTFSGFSFTESVNRARELYNVEDTFATIPTGSTIDGVNLTLTVAFFEVTLVAVRPMTEAWDESTVTFNSCGTGICEGAYNTTWNVIVSGGVTGAGENIIGINKTWYQRDFDIGTSNGLLFFGNTGATTITRSSDYGTAGDRPELCVSFTLPIVNTAPDTPTIVRPDNNEINTSSLINLAVDATDPDGDTLSITYYINGTFNGTYGYNLTSWNSSEGAYALTVTTNDGLEDSANSSVVNFIINSPPDTPTIIRPANNEKNTSVLINLAVDATDPDGDTLTITYYINDTFNGTYGYNLTSWNSSEGAYALTVTTNDGLEDSANSSVVNFIINSPPTIPSITRPDDDEINTSGAGGINLAPISTDADGDTINFDYYINGTFNGTYPYILINWNASSGFYNLSVNANDGLENSGNSSIVQFTIITPPTTPVVDYPNGLNYSKVTGIHFTSTDADGDSIVYYITINGTPNGTYTSNLTSWNASDGVYSLEISAFDGVFFSPNSSAIQFKVDSGLGLTAYYNFDGNTEDSSGNSNHLFWISEDGVSNDTSGGILGGTYDFTGGVNAGRLEAPAWMDTEFVTSSSVSVWLWHDDFTHWGTPIYFNEKWKFQVTQGESGRGSSWGTGGVGEDLELSPQIGEWNFYVWVQTSNGSQFLYIDGVINASGVQSVIATSGSSSNLIGNVGGVTQQFNGKIDELAFWHIPLTQENVTKLYSNGVAYNPVTGESGNTVPITPTISSPSPNEINNTRKMDFISTDIDSGDTITYSLYINNTFNGTYTSNLTIWNGTDGFYNLTITANDGTEDSANSSIVQFTLDTINPSTSNVEKNTTPNINGSVRLNATATDANADSYMLFHNRSNTLTNQSPASYTADVPISTTLSFLTAHENFCWGYWFNDTAGNSITTAIDCFSVANTLPTTPTDLSAEATRLAGQTITASCTDSIDFDIDIFNYLYEFFNTNDSSTKQAYSTTATYTLQEDDNHDQIRVRCKANDGYGDSGEDTVFTQVLNSVPTTPTVLSPNDGDINVSYKFIFFSTDADSDLITYSLYINGTPNGTYTSNLTIWNASDGVYELVISASDGEDVSANSSMIIFTLDTTAPLLTKQEKNVTPKINENLRMNITASGLSCNSTKFFWNNSGTLTNDSVQDCVNGAVISTTKTVTTAHKNICWGYWANDTAGNTRTTPLDCFTVNNSVPTTPTVLSPNDGDINVSYKFIFFSTDADSDLITYFIYINGTLNNTVTSNITLWNASDGTYNLTITANDGLEDSVNSSIVSFILDTQAPLFTNQEKNETPAFDNDVRMNITAFGLSCNSTKFFWNNSGTLTNDSVQDCVNGAVISTTKTTNIAHQNVCWGYWANDTAGNTRTSNLDCFTVQDTAPVVTLVSPADTDHNRVNLSVVASCTDADGDTMNATLNINNSVTRIIDSSITDNVNFNLTTIDMTEEAEYAWNIVCNNSFGSTQSTNRTYVLDLTSPIMTKVAPIDNAFINGDFDINFSCTDDYLFFANYTLFNSSQIFQSGETECRNCSYLSINNTVDISALGMADGIYNTNRTCVDSHTYEDSKTVNVTKDIATLKLDYETDSGNIISVKLKEMDSNCNLTDFGSELSSDATEYIFWFNFSCNASDSYTHVYKTSDTYDQLRYMEGTAWNGHFVTKDNYVTYHLDSGGNYTITETQPAKFETEITTTETYLLFNHSEGGLNEDFIQDTLTLDTTDPSFTNQIKNDTPHIDEFVEMNITIIDTNCDSKKFFWNFSGALTNDTASNCISGNVVSTVKQTYSSHVNVCWGYWSNDTAGNTLTSPLSCFTVLNTAPLQPNILFPADNEFTSLTILNYSVGLDLDNDTQTFDIYVNGTINVTRTSGNITVWNITDGFYNVTVSTWDGANFSINSTQISFTLDTTKPAFSGNNTNATSTDPKAGTDIQINMTVTDTNLDYCVLTTNETGTFTNGTFKQFGGTSHIVIENLTISNSLKGEVVGWEIWCNDSAGNTIVSSLQSFTVQNTPLTIRVENTFVNLTKHSFNVTAGVTNLDGFGDISATNISFSVGTCVNTLNVTSGTNFDSVWNCTNETGLVLTDIIIGFTDNSSVYVSTASSQNAFPNQAPPTPNIIFPVNSITYTTPSTLNYSVGTDTDNDSIVFDIYINGELNISRTDGNITEWNASDENYIMVVSSWDGAESSSNSTQITFTIQAQTPTPTDSPDSVSLSSSESIALFTGADVCGNNLCEIPAETSTSCPIDCGVIEITAEEVEKEGLGLNKTGKLALILGIFLVVGAIIVAMMITGGFKEGIDKISRSMKKKGKSPDDEDIFD